MLTSVYQYFDAYGRLLYVGVTARGVRRTQEHAETKEWWPLTAACTLEHFEQRDAALLREAELIRRYAPPFNTVHNPQRDRSRSHHAGSERWDRWRRFYGDTQPGRAAVLAWRGFDADRKRAAPCAECAGVAPHARVRCDECERTRPPRGQRDVIQSRPSAVIARFG